MTVEKAPAASFAPPSHFVQTPSMRTKVSAQTAQSGPVWPNRQPGKRPPTQSVGTEHGKKVADVSVARQ